MQPRNNDDIFQRVTQAFDYWERGKCITNLSSFVLVNFWFCFALFFLVFFFVFLAIGWKLISSLYDISLAFGEQKNIKKNTKVVLFSHLTFHTIYILFCFVLFFVLFLLCFVLFYDQILLELIDSTRTQRKII